MTRTRPALPPGLVLPDVSRRRFMSGAAAGGIGLGLPGLLAACGTGGQRVSADDCKSTDKSDTEKAINFSNWVEYMDPPNKPTSTLSLFKEQTGITVEYNEDVVDNTDFFAKVKNQLGDCESVGRDLFVLTDWMAARMVDSGWLQKLDHGNMPNVKANLLETLQSPAWDENRDYSVPWQSGFTGIAYNADYTGEVRSFEELLTRSDLKGKVSLLSEMRDTMGFMIKIVGGDPEDFSDDDWGKAIEELEKVVGNGHVRNFLGNDYIQPLENGDVFACEAWSGDVVGLGDNIKWVVPEEGLMIWTDNMLVPNKAEHKKNAETLMNYYYDPAVAAKLAEWNYYVCPVVGAQEEMAKIDKSLVEEPLIFPTDEFLSQTMAFMALDEKTATDYETEFSQAQG